MKKLRTLPITIANNDLLTGFCNKNGMCFLWVGTGIL